MIRAHEDYYPVDRIPQFWEWLVEQGNAGAIKIPLEVYSEIQPLPGPFKDWLEDAETVQALLLDEEPNLDLVDEVQCNGYAPDLNEAEIEQIGQDILLVSYALVSGDRIVVTKEVSRPSKKRANRKVPDVCTSVRVKCVHAFQLYRDLSFSTRP